MDWLKSGLEVQAMQQTLLTKAEFAARKNRAPSAISNWIAEGKITAAALIGDGVRAKIWLEQAEADLARSLDEGQQLAQEKPANIGPAPALEPEDETLRRTREARMRQAESDALLAELKTQKESGRWIEAHRAQQEWGRELARIMTDTETFIVQTLAREMADEFGLNWKQLAVFARDRWHKHRRGAAELARSNIGQQQEEEAANGTAG